MKTKTFTVTVTSPAPASISLNYTSLSLSVGETKQLTATVSPNGASQSVSWSVVSGSSYASVNSSGLVTANAPGTATIRATSTANSSVYKNCTVTVTGSSEVTPTSISLNTTSVSLTVGGTKQLTATVSPSGAPQSVSWSVVSGSSYASVNSSGLVTAKAAGTATIRATSTANSSVYKNCTVTVTEPVNTPGTWSGNTLTIGGSATASDYEVPYSNYYHYSTTQMLYTPTEIGKSGVISSLAFRVASSSSHATDNVKVYLGHKSGIFSSTSDYVRSSALTLVYSGSPTLGSSTGWETLTFNQGTFNYNGTDNLVVVITRSATGYTDALKYYCYTGSGYTLYRRHDTTEDYGNVSNTSYSYSASSNRPAIRMVLSSDVTPTSISLNATSASLMVGETKQLTATVSPSGASQDVTWSVVSGGSYASVNSSGLVTAKAVGTATIRATSKANSSVYKDCTVTVKERVGPVPLTMDIKQISAGFYHSLIVTTDGTLWACGSNSSGELGDGTTTNRTTPKQVMSGVASVAAGDANTMILKIDGTLWACGYNTFGQLGDGTTTDRTTPKQVMSGVASVAGSYHTMILKTNGTLWACGNNTYGQLGDGTTTERTTPKQVMSGVASVAAGDNHTMILKTDGTLWACGKNTYGRLGDGTNTDRTTPVQVMSGVASVAAGFAHTMILKTDGTLWACGWNSAGQLGDGTTSYRTTPVQVMSGVASVAAGFYHTMILRTDGTLWACGYNDSGQLCDGTTINSSTPIKIAERGNVAVTSITLDKTSLSLGVGESYRLTATVLPSNASQDVTWSSEDETIATVDEFDGTVTGVKAGTTTIGAVTDDGMHVAICQVTVTEGYTDGDILVADNADGLLLKYQIICVTDKTAKVVRADTYASATSITIPSKVDEFTIVEIGDKAFLNCSNLTAVSFPNTLVTIGEGAFSGCSKLTAITIPANVRTIGSEAFRYCHLTTLTIPGTLETIGTRSFAENEGLKTLVIENGVKSIEGYAFSSCTSLTSFVLPSSVISIGACLLYGCTSMNSVSVASDNTVYDSRDNCNGIIETATNTLVFAYDKTVIPASVTAIGDDAFTLSNVSEIVLPEGVTCIGEGAFYKQEALRTITIPASVNHIGESAFYGCSNLSEIYSKIKTPFPLEDYTFIYYNQGYKQLPATLYVPIGTKTLYENATGWKDFTNIVEMDYTDSEPKDEDFTDISKMDNVLYIEKTEVAPGSQVVLSVKMKNTGRTIQSFGFNLHLPTGFSFVKDSNGKVLCGLSPERISDESEFFKYADIVEDGSLKVVVTGLDDAIISGNDGEVYQVTIKADDNANTGTHPLIMKNVTVTDIYVNPENYEHLVYPLVVPDYMLGDADGSRALDVSDLTTVVNYMFKHFDRLPPKFNFKAADVAKPKGDLDVSDLTGIVNLMFHGTISRPKNMRKRNKTINKIPQ